MSTATSQTYTKVPFAELQAYLQNTASAEEVNYIEVTDIEAETLASDTDGSSFGYRAPSGFGEVPALPVSITGLFNCFSGCKSLKKAPAIPEHVTSMLRCFSGCKSLTEAPIIPAGVIDMYGCFENCTSLTNVPNLPKGIVRMTDCFSGCAPLTAGSITVSHSELEYYREYAAEIGADPAWFQSE